MSTTTPRTPPHVRRLAQLSLVIGAMTVVALAPSAGSDAQAAATDCAALKHPTVAAACREGGKKAVTALMKKMVKQQGAAGNGVTCESCHTDLRSFGRKPNATADLAKYLK